MFLIGLIIGLFIGSFITLILYSCMVISKEADECIDKMN